MARFGLIGPSYASQSVNADSERSVNWYPEIIESGQGKSQMALYTTPGLKLFSTLAGPSVRGLLTINGRTFGVSGNKFSEVLANGTKQDLGNVQVDTLPASMASSATQILIASGGVLYTFNLSTNTFAIVASPPGPPAGVAMVGYSDGFFIALIKNTGQFFVSTALDATSWPGTATAIVSVFPDNVLGTVVDHRELWLFGPKNSIVYYDSGNVPVPFDVIPGGFIEQGIAGPFAAVKGMDNSVYWVGSRDDQGGAIVWRAQGYTPTRVSNHAVEFALQGYSKISDCIAYCYQDQGHSFLVLYFPTANATWVYDAATGMWHERGNLDPVTGNFRAQLSRTHTFNFGKHLVGDWNSGKVYEQSISFLDDAGSPIRRVRRSPHITLEQEWIFHHQLQVDLETGLGPEPPLLDGQGNPRDPQMMLRWSDDAGHTWSNTYTRDAGQAGQYRTRVIWRRLGRSRNRVYEISVSDRIPWRIVDGFVLATPGFEPSERLAKQIAKVS